MKTQMPAQSRTSACHTVPLKAVLLLAWAISGPASAPADTIPLDIVNMTAETVTFTVRPGSKYRGSQYQWPRAAVKVEPGDHANVAIPRTNGGGAGSAEPYFSLIPSSGENEPQHFETDGQGNLLQRNFPNSYLANLYTASYATIETADAPGYAARLAADKGRTWIFEERDPNVVHARTYRIQHVAGGKAMRFSGHAAPEIDAYDDAYLWVFIPVRTWPFAEPSHYYIMNLQSTRVLTGGSNGEVYDGMRYEDLGNGGKMELSRDGRHARQVALQQWELHWQPGNKHCRLKNKETGQWLDRSAKNHCVDSSGPAQQQTDWLVKEIGSADLAILEINSIKCVRPSTGIDANTKILFQGIDAAVEAAAAVATGGTSAIATSAGKKAGQKALRAGIKQGFRNAGKKVLGKAIKETAKEAAERAAKEALEATAKKLAKIAAMKAREKAKYFTKRAVRKGVEAGLKKAATEKAKQLVIEEVPGVRSAIATWDNVQAWHKVKGGGNLEDLADSDSVSETLFKAFGGTSLEDDFYLKFNHVAAWPKAGHNASGNHWNADPGEAEAVGTTHIFKRTQGAHIELMEYDSGSNDDSLGSFFHPTHDLDEWVAVKDRIVEHREEGSLYLISYHIRPFGIWRHDSDNAPLGISMPPDPTAPSRFPLGSMERVVASNNYTLWHFMENGSPIVWNWKFDEDGTVACRAVDDGIRWSVVNPKLRLVELLLPDAKKVVLTFDNTFGEFSFSADIDDLVSCQGHPKYWRDWEDEWQTVMPAIEAVELAMSPDWGPPEEARLGWRRLKDREERYQVAMTEYYLANTSWTGDGFDFFLAQGGTLLHATPKNPGLLDGYSWRCTFPTPDVEFYHPTKKALKLELGSPLTTFTMADFGGQPVTGRTKLQQEIVGSVWITSINGDTSNGYNQWTFKAGGDMVGSDLVPGWKWELMDPTHINMYEGKIQIGGPEQKTAGLVFDDALTAFSIPMKDNQLMIGRPKFTYFLFNNTWLFDHGDGDKAFTLIEDGTIRGSKSLAQRMWRVTGPKTLEIVAVEGGQVTAIVMRLDFDPDGLKFTCQSADGKTTTGTAKPK